MNLDELYEQILQREPLKPYQVTPGMRIAVIYQDGIHIMTVGETGLARLGMNGCRETIAIAKIGPEQPAMNWSADGYLRLALLQPVPEHQTLKTNYSRVQLYAPWEQMQSRPVVQLTGDEKHAIWKNTPLEKRVDQNTGGLITQQNQWFYQ